MRSIATRPITTATRITATTVLVLGVMTAIGCGADGSASGDFDPTTEASPSDPTHVGASLPAKGEELPTSAGSSKDAGAAQQKDGSTRPGGPPEEGASCATPNEVFKRSCGLCGTQEAMCLVSAAGVNFVSAYGSCRGEVADGCKPGSTESAECGDCGTQTRTCNNYCVWTTSSCQNQPQNHCTKGAVELLDTGCPTGQFRTKVCNDSCTWNGASLACSAPPATVLAAPTPGSVNSTLIVLRETQTIGRLFIGMCPGGDSDNISNTLTPYAYVEVKNPNPTPVTVSIYNSQATATSPILDTIMAAYDGAAIPATLEERRNCLMGVSDMGTSSLTGDSKWASLDGARAITLAPGASVQVYTAAYPAFNTSNPDASTGEIKLNVKTESVNR